MLSSAITIELRCATPRDDRARAASRLLSPPPVRRSRRDAPSSRRARAASPPSSMRAPFAWRTAARSASPASSRSTRKTTANSEPHLGAGRDRDRPRGDVARRRRHARPLRPSARLRVSRLAPTHLVQGLLLAQGDALVSATVTDKDCAAVLTAAEAAARAGQTGNLGRSRGHKKRGKSGRYFGRDRAFYGGRGQGFVRPAGRGNDLPEFRTELDTGLCCDYFKAHDSGVRGGRNCA